MYSTQRCFNCSQHYWYFWYGTNMFTNPRQVNSQMVLRMWSGVAVANLCLRFNPQSHSCDLVIDRRCLFVCQKKTNLWTATFCNEKLRKWWCFPSSKSGLRRIACVFFTKQNLSLMSYHIFKPGVSGDTHSSSLGHDGQYLNQNSEHFSMFLSTALQLQTKPRLGF